MPFNGSGVFSFVSNSWSPAVSATTIDSADWNTLRSDLATAISTAICKDGQTTITANLPMSTYRHTGVSNATALDQYATADQVVDNALCYGGASAAGTDTYAVNLAVSPGAYAAGQRYSFIADVANTGACTINFNTIGAASIKMQDGTDPFDGAIIANQIVEVEYDGTNMVLLNPEIPSNYINTFDNNQRIDASGTTNEQEFYLGSSGLDTRSRLRIETDSGNLSIYKTGSAASGAGNALIDNESNNAVFIRTGSTPANKVAVQHFGGLTVYDDAQATPSANTLYADSMVKAWIDLTISGGAPSITDDFNISSVSDIAVGSTRINFAVAMANSTYGVGLAVDSVSNVISLISSPNTTYVYLNTRDADSPWAGSDASIRAIISGRQ